MSSWLRHLFARDPCSFGKMRRIDQRTFEREWRAMQLERAMKETNK